MTTSADVINGCRDENPVRSTEDIGNSDNSAALASLLAAAGVTTCGTGSGAIGGLFPPFGGIATVSVGCEQVSALAQSLDASQRVFQCSMFKLSQVTETVAKTELTINVTLGEGFTAQNCEFVFEQVSGMKVATYSQLDSEVKKSMNAEVMASAEGFLKNVQDEKKKGLFGGSEGQKAFQLVEQSITNYINNTSITDVVQRSLTKYENTGTINIETKPDVAIIWIAQSQQQPYPSCMRVTQNFMMQAVSQSIFTNMLNEMFDADAKAALKSIMENSQSRTSDTGFGLPGFGSFLIILLIIIIVVPLIFSKKDNKETGQKEPILSGPAGKGLGIALMVIGFGLVIAGIVMLIIANKIVGGILLGGGAILAIIGIVLFVKARSQQTIYEQNLAIAKAASGGGGGGQNLAAQLIEKQ